MEKLPEQKGLSLYVVLDIGKYSWITMKTLFRYFVNIERTKSYKSQLWLSIMNLANTY